MFLYFLKLLEFFIILKINLNTFFFIPGINSCLVANSCPHYKAYIVDASDNHIFFFLSEIKTCLPLNVHIHVLQTVKYI